MLKELSLNVYELTTHFNKSKGALTNYFYIINIDTPFVKSISFKLV